MSIAPNTRAKAKAVAPRGVIVPTSPSTSSTIASKADSLVTKPISGGTPAIESAARPPTMASHGAR
ncbi:hypothetical protein [Tessaracoccus caeni]|uniref:hypothetical protein n=1 Tax=Tessaracoccus caeni TaxID=3031239 RepID=UPI0023DB68C6|nr:hypothetical protein [Tessaracoccus caeni]MDF1487323.1 hypothetical protein [Tessaracoccus caeni]